MVAYSALRETRRLELRAYDVRVPGLPKELDGFRIAQLSDLHRSLIVPDSLIRRAVDLANTSRADVAVLTGDFVSRNADNAEPCARMLSRLRTRGGSFAILGNHDHWTDARTVAAALRRHGITVLDNKSVEVVPGLYLVGIDDQWAGRPDVPAAFAGVGSNACYVMLSHTPLAVDLFTGKRGLLITGHTHGGQVQIPLVNRKRLPGLRGWRYIQGWYREGDILMYVNRGIGTVNPAVRFRCRPEVTVYVLHRGDSDARPRRGSNHGNTE